MTSTQPIIYDTKALQKLKQLIESTQDVNIKIALQIIKSNGVNPALITHLYAVMTLSDDESLQIKATQLVQQILPEDRITILYEMPAQANGQTRREQKAAAWLRLTEKVPEIDTPLFAQLMLLFKAQGFAYCLKNQLMSTKTILDKIYATEERTLFFDHFELDELPDEVGLYPYTDTLDLTGNHFKELPDSMAQLRQLKNVYFNGTPLSNQAIQNLEKWAPKAMAAHYETKAHEACGYSNDEEVLAYAQKAYQLDASHTKYLHTVNIQQERQQVLEKHLTICNKLIGITPHNLVAYTRKADVLIRLKRAEEAITTLKKGFEKVQAHASKDKIIRLHFLKAQAHHHLGDFDEAHQHYDMVLKIEPQHPKTHYQKAMIYAKQRNKSLMIKHLLAAIKLDANILWQASKEAYFSHYWQDADFKVLFEKK